MSKICEVTDKKPMFGNNRSHALNARKRKFFLNLHVHRFWIPEKKKFIKLKVSAKAMRIIDKNGIMNVLNQKLIKKLCK